MKKLLLFVLILLPMMASAETHWIDGFNYILDIQTKQAEVVSNVKKYTGSITIPNKVSYQGVEYSVTSIGSTAFYGCSGLTSVTIPNSVTSINYQTFWGCI